MDEYEPEPPADMTGFEMETIRTPSAGPPIALAVLVAIVSVIVFLV